MVYPYIGPHELRHLLRDPTPRMPIHHPADVRTWIVTTHQRLNADRTVTTTFIVAVDGTLWIADQHSEHVVCARGDAVLTAGEMTFEVHPHHIEVVAITNQSTGYCPPPESWPAVVAALDHIPLVHPETWRSAYTFRRCTTCSTINIVKDAWYECAVCQTPLSRDWNF